VNKFITLVLLGCMWVTAYTPWENGGNRITASGNECAEGVTYACNDYPLGTKLLINGHVYTVQDRMFYKTHGVIDIFMEDYNRAMQFGRQWLEVVVI
jgi:3D (Asp-Asp-Asp) domain-containing protein